MIQQLIEKQFFIPVIRTTDAAMLERIVESLFHAGLELQEITLMSDSLIPVIGKLTKRFNVTIGAGTVLNAKQAQAVIDQGAKFLVSPGLAEDVSKLAHQQKQLYIPGVMTPTEIMLALNHGHELLKLFPLAPLGGLNYLASLEAPFPQVKWMLSGGIKVADASQYRRASVSAVGLGGDLLPKELVAKGDWNEITRRVQVWLTGSGA
jgi:2-dehydro-3-deoxyphosphogluconate aldolase / (4S)-4-hydroxy-2-oxoglutarate aldolase